MPASPPVAAAPSDNSVSTDATATVAAIDAVTAPTKPARTRTNRAPGELNAPQALLSAIADALTEGVRVYRYDAAGLSAFLDRVAPLVKAGSMGESAKFAGRAEMVADMIKLALPPATAPDSKPTS